MLDGTHPRHMGLLETLNIFAVRANYMSQFREYLEKEGVETEEMVELPLFVRINKNFLRKGLVVPRVRMGAISRRRRTSCWFPTHLCRCMSICL